MDEITVSIMFEIRRFSNSAAVYQANADGKIYNVVLQAEPDEIEFGQTYTLHGRWRDRGIYGMQFQADSWVVTAPLTKRAVLYYLEKLPGIGPKTAEQIYERYGEIDTLRKIVENPDRMATIPRFNVSKARGLALMIQGDLETITTKIEIQAYLAGSGFPRKLGDRLYNRFGVRTLETIRRNPYLLLQYEGCGFLRVDEFALKNGFPKNRLKRQALFLLHRMEEEGDTWFPMQQGLQPLLVQQFGTNARLGRTVQLLQRAKRIEVKAAASDYLVATTKDAKAERTIATEVAARCQMPNIKIPFDTASLTAAQAAALTTATSSLIGCFVGGPGTGKTYTTARYIQAACDTYGSRNVLVVAPTGKAVVRSREMLRSIGVECPAGTIHSYILSEAESTFSAIICDEASMIDADLMAAFLTKARGANILFVGDDGQLLPVGKGRPFADFLESGIVPVGKLTETMRNSGRIVQTCHQIRAGQSWQCSPAMDLERGENLEIWPTGRDALDTIKGIVGEWRDRIDPIRDIQVIVGINKGPSGREALNAALQDFLNPGLGGKYRTGDPVICLKNGKYRDTEGREEAVYLSNGEIGYCVAIGGRITVDFGLGKMVQITEKQTTFDLAYAVTCHKMQGSETPIAIVVLDDTVPARMVCTREWLYTAISRAKKACYLVGDRSTAEAFCRKRGNVRLTQLRELLCEQTRNAKGTRRDRIGKAPFG